MKKCVLIIVVCLSTSCASFNQWRYDRALSRWEVKAVKLISDNKQHPEKWIKHSRQATKLTKKLVKIENIPHD